jgi:hypothetical protein
VVTARRLPSETCEHQIDAEKANGERQQRSDCIPNPFSSLLWSVLQPKGEHRDHRPSESDSAAPKSQSATIRIISSPAVWMLMLPSIAHRTSAGSMPKIVTNATICRIISQFRPFTFDSMAFTLNMRDKR